MRENGPDPLILKIISCGFQTYFPAAENEAILQARLIFKPAYWAAPFNDLTLMDSCPTPDMLPLVKHLKLTAAHAGVSLQETITAFAQTMIHNPERHSDFVSVVTNTDGLSYSNFEPSGLEVTSSAPPGDSAYRFVIFVVFATVLSAAVIYFS